MTTTQRGKAAARARKPQAATVSRQIDDLSGDPDFMKSLARGLAVLQGFGDHRKGLTISQLSQRTGIPRAAVRRCLLTLQKLGYVAADGDAYLPCPKVLSLGQGFLSSNALAASAQGVLDELRDALHESCSLGVLEGDEVCYIARAETTRIMSISLRVGSRLPAYCTSMGRVLLAALPAAELQTYLGRTPLLQRTRKTVTAQSRLLQILDGVRRNGYAVGDQELELGLRSIAVPVRDRDGRVVAALNIGTQSARVPLHDLESYFLDKLKASAHQLGLRA
jgi:IclR family transcriptional regulator, pca regulon regulatory protein